MTDGNLQVVPYGIWLPLKSVLKAFQDSQRAMQKAGMALDRYWTTKETLHTMTAALLCLHLSTNRRAQSR